VWFDNYNKAHAVNQQNLLKSDLYGQYNWTGSAIRCAHGDELVDMTVKPGLNGSFEIRDIASLNKKVQAKLKRLIDTELFKKFDWTDRYKVDRNPVTVTLSKDDKKKNPDLAKRSKRECTGLIGNFYAWKMTPANIAENRGKMHALHQLHEWAERKINGKDQYIPLLSDMAIFQGLFKVSS
jgi:hypothetical protein